MTPDEAIQILTEHAYKKMKQFDEDLTEAEKLGIEALERLQLIREFLRTGNKSLGKIIEAPLPSETEAINAQP